LRSGSELSADGRLVIYPSTACESYRGATNPTDAVSGLHACVDGILALDPSLLVVRNRDYFKQLRERLPRLPFYESAGRQLIGPAESFLRSQRDEAPHFYPLFPFNRFDLMGTDHDRVCTFRDTWSHGTFFKGVVASWHQDGIFLARMGMTEEAAAYNLRKLDDGPRRFPTFWGPGHDWVPDHNHGGSGMIGLQEMLMQTVGDQILLLPAWPATWDVDFRLHAPHETVVTASVRQGKVVQLDVVPASRLRDVRVCGMD